MEKPLVTVRVLADQDRVLIATPRGFDQTAYEAIRRLPGRKWNPRRKIWSAPHAETAIASLRRMLGPTQVAVLPSQPSPPAPPSPRPQHEVGKPEARDRRRQAGPGKEEEDVQKKHEVRRDRKASREAESRRDAEASRDPDVSRTRRDAEASRDPDVSRTRRDAEASRDRGASRNRDASRRSAAVRAPDPGPAGRGVTHGSDVLDLVRQALVMRGYSPRTAKVYLGHLRRFLTWCGNGTPTLPADPAATAQTYILELAQGDRFSKSYHNQVVSALRFMCEFVLGRPKLALRIPRPKKERKLPSVLSPAEVSRLLERTQNPKHHALLTLLYSAGLRVGEVVRLRPHDLDAQRGLLHVRSGKGGKDRYTLLARRAVDAVQQYRDAYPTSRWLFPGADPEHHLTTRSVQRMVARAAERADIPKHVTAHTLRHSFATHLLEGGTNIRVIQELLGHESARTTQIYTHIARSTLETIRSPLDNLD